MWVSPMSRNNLFGRSKSSSSCSSGSSGTEDLTDVVLLGEGLASALPFPLTPEEFDPLGLSKSLLSPKCLGSPSSVSTSSLTSSGCSSGRKRKFQDHLESLSNSIISSSSSLPIPVVVIHDSDSVSTDSIKSHISSSSSSGVSSKSSSTSSSSFNSSESFGKGTLGLNGTISSSLNSSTNINNNLIPIKKSERLLSKSSNSSKSDPSSDVQEPVECICQWKECSSSGDEKEFNLLEHVQTVHVSPQCKTDGYVCLWKGCKVFNKKSCSLSWLERHVLSHGGTKPFKCIFLGCGLSFGSQGALERHVNSHIITNGSGVTANGHPSVTQKIESSPNKLARRKKARARKQKLTTSQHVDYFDKRAMEVIKFRLVNTLRIEETNIHSCTFSSQVLSRRTCTNEEPQVLVRWYPRFILPDEWMPQSQHVQTKNVEYRQIPPDKIRNLFPNMFPPERKEKAQRKWKKGKVAPLPPLPDSSKSEGHQETVKVEATNDEGLSSDSCGELSKCPPLDHDWVDFLEQQMGL